MRDWLGEAKAKQVYLILRDRSLTGAIAFGAKLPTENKLAEVPDVSRVTIHRALGELARDRLIERRRSASTRAIYRPVLVPLIAVISGMLASLADTGRRTAVKLTSFAYVTAEGAVAQLLAVPSNQVLQRSVRVRSVDGEPFSYLSSYVPESISLTFTPQELASRPLFDLMERAIEHLHALYRPDATLSKSTSSARARGTDRGHLLRASREMATRLQRRALDHQEQTVGRQGAAQAEGSTPCRIRIFR